MHAHGLAWFMRLRNDGVLVGGDRLYPCCWLSSDRIDCPQLCIAIECAIGYTATLAVPSALFPSSPLFSSVSLLLLSVRSFLLSSFLFLFAWNSFIVAHS